MKKAGETKRGGESGLKGWREGGRERGVAGYVSLISPHHHHHLLPSSILRFHFLRGNEREGGIGGHGAKEGMV